jgi:hypothetical protein
MVYILLRTLLIIINNIIYIYIYITLYNTKSGFGARNIYSTNILV